MVRLTRPASAQSYPGQGWIALKPLTLPADGKVPQGLVPAISHNVAVRGFRDAGYNAWADANHIIVLYPQAAPWLRLADPSQITGNPKGCWDWWGYSGDDYLGQNGKQMRAVRGMIGRMLP